MSHELWGTLLTERGGDRVVSEGVKKLFEGVKGRGLDSGEKLSVVRIAGIAVFRSISLANEKDELGRGKSGGWKRRGRESLLLPHQAAT